MIGMKEMDFKLLGSILLIVGTSIGAGMLALPIATAQIGFIGSVILLLICWFVMTAGAFLILEVNLWLPQKSNIISMAKATLGPFGQLIAWLTYLLLLYSLLCAYIAGGSDLLHHVLQSRIKINDTISAILFTIVFGSVVYLGIRSVDYVNRGLMLAKFTAYTLLVIFLVPLISFQYLQAGDIHQISSATAIIITITSFGFSTIVPSLRIYFAGNIQKLKLAILIGSLIPLICYILWDAIIMGVVPLEGAKGLVSILHSNNSTSDLVISLSDAANKTSITFLTKLFTSICVLTSFLGVALCLTDFLADGFQIEKQGMHNFLIQLLTLLPPLIVVIFYPKAFIHALEYAGIYSLILLVLLPAWMAFRGRYHKKIATGFRVFGGSALIIFLLLFSFFVILWSILNQFYQLL